MDYVKLLTKLVEDNSKTYVRLLKAKSYSKQYGKLLEYVLHNTPLLDSLEYSLTTRVYWILNNIKSFDDPRCCCHHCHKNGEHRNVKNIFKGYNDFCCKKCMHDSSLRKDKYKEACFKKFGVENASLCISIKDKKKTTALKNYGVDNPAKSSEVKHKIQLTNLTRYNAKCSFQNDAVKENASRH